MYNASREQLNRRLADKEQASPLFDALHSSAMVRRMVSLIVATRIRPGDQVTQ